MYGDITKVQGWDERVFELSEGIFGGQALYINGKYTGRVFDSIEEGKQFVEDIHAREIKFREEMKNPRRNEIHADPYKGGISGVTYWGD